MWRAAGILLLGLALGAASVLTYQFVTTEPDEPLPRTGPGATSDSRRAVVAQGTLEPRDGQILVASSLVGYEIKRVAVKEGDEVLPKKLLLEIEAAAIDEELKAAQAQKRDAQERQTTEIELAQQRLEAADLAVTQAEEAQELELVAQTKRVEVAKLKAGQAENDLTRYSSLATGEDPLVSAQQLQQQEVLRDLSNAEQEAAQVALKRLKQTLEFQLQKARAEQKAAKASLALAQKGTSLEALDAQIALAKLKLEQAQVTSPVAGTVLAVAAHEGELIGTQPLVQIANLDHLICVAEVDVSDVTALHEGSPAAILSRAFGSQKLRGTIERIGSPAAQASLRPVDPRQSVDRTVTKVVIKFDADEARKILGVDKKGAAALVGLQVDVEFAIAAAAPSAE